MYGKIQITGTIEVVTGMHIGGSSAFSAIGAVDSPIVRDVRSNLPMIPGSSLKGKMRSLLAKQYNESIVDPNNDHPRIARLFGSAKKNAVKPGRLLFSDMILSNEGELRRAGLQSLTEIKFENTIIRASAEANPRQIERSVRGSKYDMDLVYEVSDTDELLEDMETLGMGMKLLQYDYLGGSGSRGYGKVRFKGLKADAVTGEIDDSLVAKCNEVLKGFVEG